MALKDMIVRGKEAEFFRVLLRLKRAGWNVGIGERPGLTYVSGRQLTVQEVFDLAAKLK